MSHQFLLLSFTDDDSDDEDEKGRMEPDVESHQPHQSKRNGKVSIPFNSIQFHSFLISLLVFRTFIFPN